MRHTIMCIDDVPINVMMLESILEDDYDVITATSGAQALDRMSSEPYPDMVLLDLSMPDMDGFEVLEVMKKNKKLTDIPVIFVTGETDVFSEEKGLDLGAVDYIKKPYVPGVIKLKIRNHIELKTYRDHLEELVDQRTKELMATHEAIIMGMSLLSESRDQVTGAHIQRIKLLTNIIADKMAELEPGIFTSGMIHLITTYSALHDVGKVGVPDAVLNKGGSLTKEEFELMKQHTAMGADLLRKVVSFLPGNQNQLNVAIDIAENHHEKCDGSGYPLGIKDDEIPIAAKIVALADVYDALRSPRPYKNGFSHEEACKIILEGDGRTHPSHFDPRVLVAFRSIHEMMRDTFDDNQDIHMG